MPATITINVPGRIIGFYEGGQAHQDYVSAERQGRVPVPTRDLAADELALFNAVRVGIRVRAGSGYYVKAELTPEAIEALRYWGETLESCSADGAREGDQDARNDLRAATRMLERLPRA
jgi:hypothetical protein